MNGNLSTVPALSGDDSNVIFLRGNQNGPAEKPNGTGDSRIFSERQRRLPMNTTIERRNTENIDVTQHPDWFDRLTDLQGDLQSLDKGEISKGEFKERYLHEFNCWKAMRYERTGKDGDYTRHPAFDSFPNFMRIMNPAPGPTYTLDRVDSSDPEYAPRKVVWAPKASQTHNRSNTRYLIDSNGTRLTVAEWSRKLGVPGKTILKRIDVLKWSVDSAIYRPVRQNSARSPVQSVADSESSAPYTEIWERVMRDKHKQKFVVFKAKDKKMLKDIAKLFSEGDLDPQEALEGILTDWSGFTSYCEHIYGVYHKLSPKVPTIEYLIKWLTSAGNFYLERKDEAEQRADRERQKQRQREAQERQRQLEQEQQAIGDFISEVLNNRPEVREVRALVRGIQEIDEAKANFMAHLKSKAADDTAKRLEEPRAMLKGINTVLKVERDMALTKLMAEPLNLEIPDYEA